MDAINRIVDTVPKITIPDPIKLAKSRDFCDIHQMVVIITVVINITAIISLNSTNPIFFYY